MDPERVDAVPPRARRMAVGDTARRTRTVSTRDIELFTEMTGDRNPLHYDNDLTRRSRFGGIIVQGGVTTGLLTRSSRRTCPDREACSCGSTGGSWRPSARET
jgi:acyl dehydratase